MSDFTRFKNYPGPANYNSNSNAQSIMRAHKGNSFGRTQRSRDLKKSNQIASIYSGQEFKEYLASKGL